MVSEVLTLQYVPERPPAQVSRMADAEGGDESLPGRSRHRGGLNGQRTARQRGGEYAPPLPGRAPKPPIPAPRPVARPLWSCETAWPVSNYPCPAHEESAPRQPVASVALATGWRDQ